MKPPNLGEYCFGTFSFCIEHANPTNCRWVLYAGFGAGFKYIFVFLPVKLGGNDFYFEE